MDRDSVGVLLGGFYMALCTGLSDEGVRLANDILCDLAERPSITPEEARIFRLVAQSAGGKTNERPRFEVITGGVA